MSDNKLLPWQDTEWTALWGHPGGLPHALLLTGPEGIGKRRFADALAARLLCETATGTDHACGRCDSCRWLAAGNHPDFRRVIPEADADDAPGDAEEPAAKTEKAEKKKSQQILIGQIRALANFVYMGAHRAHGRVIVVQPAEAMNPAAANSLLKILEEPSPSVYFILVSDLFRKLLPTIRSRCRSLALKRPDPVAARAWLAASRPEATALLAVCGGAPLRALAAAELGWVKILATLEASFIDVEQDELRLAATWEGVLKNPEVFAMDDFIGILQKWLADLISRHQAGRARFFPEDEKQLAGLLGRTRGAALLHCYNQLQQARALANHPLNARLFLEDIAARYLAVFATAPRDR